MIFEFLAVALGGALGSVMRHGLSVMAIRCGLCAEWSTLSANVLGSFLIGLVMSCADGRLYLLLAVGLCGGFTTFSTFSAQTLRFLERGLISYALLYIASSLILSVAGVALGLFLGSKVHLI